VVLVDQGDVESFVDRDLLDLLEEDFINWRSHARLQLNIRKFGTLVVTLQYLIEHQLIDSG